MKFRKTGKKKPGDNILLSMCTINEDYMIYSSKFWENEKKTCRDIIILHLCTTNDNHMMYGSRDMECNRPNFLPFLIIFCPFTPKQPRKSKFQKNLKKP